MSLLAPRKTKHRKFQRRLRQIRGNNPRCNKLEYGDYGIRVLEGTFVKDRQIEAFRLASLRVMREMKEKRGEVKFRIFPHRSLTKKPLGVRMGSGKGDIDCWAATVRAQTIICEFLNIAKTTAERLYKELNVRIGVKVELVTRDIPVQCQGETETLQEEILS